MSDRHRLTPQRTRGMPSALQEERDADVEDRNHIRSQQSSILPQWSQHEARHMSADNRCIRAGLQNVDSSFETFGCGQAQSQFAQGEIDVEKYRANSKDELEGSTETDPEVVVIHYQNEMSEEEGGKIDLNELTLTRNANCHHEPYFCGQCETVFFQVDGFVSHCLQVCHSQNNQQSSHFISTKHPNAKENDDLEEDSQQSKQNKKINPQPSQMMLQLLKPRSMQVEYQQPSSFYLCKCGEQFQFYSKFKKHQAQAHQLIKPLDQQIQKLPPLSFIQKYKDLDGEIDEIESFEDAKEKKKLKTKRIKRSDKKSSGIEVRQEIDGQIMNWKEFTLVRNLNCHEEPYYCGSCSIIYFKAETYAFHSLNECKNKDFSSSSHVIQPKSNPKVTNGNQFQKNELSVKLRAPSKILLPQLVDCRPLIQIFRKRLDHRDIPFYCGSCNVYLKNYFGFFQHNSKTHQSKIPQNSSHVILQFYLEKIVNIYLALTIAWPHANPSYFCPCNLHLKMCMKDLINHMKNVHSGFSPLYGISQKRIRRLPQQQKENDEVEQEDSRPQPSEDEIETASDNNFSDALVQQYRFIFDIYRLKTDHRYHPFYCGKCEKQFAECNAFRSHIEMGHNFYITPTSSHVILLLNNGWQRKHVFLASNVLWHHREPVYFCPCNFDAKLSMDQLVSHLFDSHHGYSPVYFQKLVKNIWKIGPKLIILQADPILKQFRRRQNQNCTPLLCETCQLELPSKRGYRDHMKFVHDNIIHPESSHVILRGILCGSIRNIYLAQNVPFNSSQNQYYCSCSPQIKVKLEQLIAHIKQAHQSVSPYYHFVNDHFVGKAKSPSKKTKDFFPKSVIKSIYNMKQYSESLRLPFACNICSRTFINGKGYISHIKHHKGLKLRDCSHVILRIQPHNNRNKHIYISPEIEQEHERVIYYCPCEFSNKMSMHELLYHQIEHHNYVSPFYYPQKIKQKTE